MAHLRATGAFQATVVVFSHRSDPMDRSLGRNGGGGGSRTPVRKALRLEDYMLIAFDLVRQRRLERARRAAD